MKLLTIPIAENRTVGINSNPKSTVLMFECPNDTPEDMNPEMTKVIVTPESIKTFIKLTPTAAEALRILLNQELINE